jgi:hypothetical protein
LSRGLGEKEGGGETFFEKKFLPRTPTSKNLWKKGDRAVAWAARSISFAIKWGRGPTRTIDSFIPNRTVKNSAKNDTKFFERGSG